MSRFDIDRKLSGIYKIINITNNKIYIGSAISLRKRWNTHLYDLSKNKHHSILLQRAWNKYTSAQFKFEVIELVEDKNKLVEREQYWLDFYKSYLPENGYNICKIAGSQAGHKHTEETKNLMSKSHMGKTLGHKGAIHTEAFIEKQRQRHLGNKYSVGLTHKNPRKGTTDTKKNCLKCSVEFHGRNCELKRRKYCSQQCSHDAYRGKYYNV